MKKVLITLLIGVCSLVAYSQPVFAKSNTLAVGVKNSVGTFDWGTPQVTGDILIKIDAAEINIHSVVHQQYFLYSDVNELNDDDTACWMAYDKDGERCRVYLLKNDVGEAFLMVEYNDISWIYNLIMTK
jgi:hypothetical protein